MRIALWAGLVAPLVTSGGIAGCGRSALDALGEDTVGIGMSPGTDGGSGTGLDASIADATSQADVKRGGDDGEADAAQNGDACPEASCRKTLAVTAGYNHACALMSDGTVECWGQNVYGQLGNATGVTCSGPSCVDLDGTVTWPPGYEASVPLEYPPTLVSGLAGVTAIAAGNNHTCAVLSDGTVRCWGYNVDGQLGNGTTASSYAPTQVSDLANVAGVSASFEYTCAWRTDGTVVCWGTDDADELGSTVTTTCEDSDDHWCSTTPVAVPGVVGAKAVAAAAGFACALLADGTLTCWGQTQGIGSAETPSQLPVVAGATSVVGSFGDHACVVLNDATADCWGRNAAGELGRGMLSGPSPWGWTPTPAPVIGLSGVMAMAVGTYFTCALVSGGTVDCWGYNGVGALGRDLVGTSLTVQPGPPLTNVSAITAGSGLACALLGNGTVQCWGDGDSTPTVVPL